MAGAREINEWGSTSGRRDTRGKTFTCCKDARGTNFAAEMLEERREQVKVTRLPSLQRGKFCRVKAFAGKRRPQASVAGQNISWVFR